MSVSAAVLLNIAHGQWLEGARGAHSKPTFATGLRAVVHEHPFTDKGVQIGGTFVFHTLPVVCGASPMP